MHPLHSILVEAANGTFPAIDGGVEVYPPMRGGHHAVVEFTGHSVVLTDRDETEVLAHGADGYGGASQPDLVRWLAGPDGWIGSLDAVLVARGTGGGFLRERDDHDDHRRIRRARRHRLDVHVHGDEFGLVILGRGLVGRRELAVELFDIARGGAGHGRALIAEGLALVPAGELVWAQVAPGNASSLRAFLGSGFVPVGSETLLMPDRSPD